MGDIWAWASGLNYAKPRSFRDLTSQSLYASIWVRRIRARILLELHKSISYQATLDWMTHMRSHFGRVEMFSKNLLPIVKFFPLIGQSTLIDALPRHKLGSIIEHISPKPLYNLCNRYTYFSQPITKARCPYALSGMDPYTNQSGSTPTLNFIKYME